MHDKPQGGDGRPASRFERPGTITAGAVLAVALVVSVLGSVVTYASVRSAFAQHTAIDRTRDDLAKLFQLELDQETGLRGYISTGERVFLEPYNEAKPQYTPLFDELERYVNSSSVAGASAPLFDLQRQHLAWEAQVAEPLIKAPNAPDAVVRLERGKVITDQSRADYKQLSAIFDARSQGLIQESFDSLLRAAIITAALILLFGAAAIVADVHRSRTQAALARERAVTDTLQRAFLSGWDMLPYLRIGTAYVSSTREATVGGDLFDVHRLDEHQSMLLVADVSGKGLAAAVETAQVKYSVRTLAELESDPASVLRRFNRTFLRSGADLGAFVSVFLGLLDERTLTLRYASAGHSSVFVRSAKRVTALPVTGPVIGLSESDVFQSGNLALGVGDTIVLATDGLTEARDPAGVMLGEEQAMRWIERGNPDPQRLADEIVRRLERYGGGRIADDLALLIIRVQRVRAGAAPPSDNVERRDVAPTPQGGTFGAA